jgi:RNA polymerase sigma-70 factor (TIGR02960 family)
VPRFGSEHLLLARARAGDDVAFGELTAPYVDELRLHCYRVLGSLADADDLLQETLLAAWRGLDGFEGRASLRAWLYRIATNRCLNAIRDAKRRPPAEPVAPFRPPDPSRRGEVTWLQPYPDTLLEHFAESTPGPDARYEMQASVELAFIVALQRLPPRQAAVVILADVLSFSTAEVADMLDSSAIIIKGLLQRARASLSRRHAADAHQPAGGAGSPSERALARRFAEALTVGDIDTIVALLTDDAVLAMPPAPHEYLGTAAIGAFLRASTDWRGARRLLLESTRANGQPALSCYLIESEQSTAHPVGVIVLTMSGTRISGITRFLDETLNQRFGLGSQVTVDAPQ